MISDKGDCHDECVKAGETKGQEEQEEMEGKKQRRRCMEDECRVMSFQTDNESKCGEICDMMVIRERFISTHMMQNCDWP